jgi:hypothetical protein
MALDRAVVMLMAASVDLGSGGKGRDRELCTVAGARRGEVKLMLSADGAPTNDVTHSPTRP